MQRQDDFHITRTDMLLFIAQLLSLADAVIRIIAQCRTIDDRLLHSFARSEIAMLIVLGGIVSNTDTRGATPGLNDIIEFDEPPDRQAEFLRIGASFQQIAMALAMLLAMHPRAFRDRRRCSSLRGGAFPPPCGQGGSHSEPGGVTSTTQASLVRWCNKKHAPAFARLIPLSPLGYHSRKGEGALAVRAPP